MLADGTMNVVPPDKLAEWIAQGEDDEDDVDDLAEQYSELLDEEPEDSADL
jgi:hypothetical protein